MTRTDFLKLIPAAILALFWPEEAKAEANTPLSDIWECDPAAFSDGHDRVFVFGGETPGKIRATAAAFTGPVEFRRTLISPGFPANGTVEEKREWWLKHSGVVEISNPERFFE